MIEYTLSTQSRPGIGPKGLHVSMNDLQLVKKGHSTGDPQHGFNDLGKGGDSRSPVGNDEPAQGTNDGLI